MKAGIWPSWRFMIGPYFSASRQRDWWGSSPSWCRFPTTGNLLGPGGSFLLLLLVLNLELKTRSRRTVTSEIMRMHGEKKSSSIISFSSIYLVWHFHIYMCMCTRVLLDVNETNKVGCTCKAYVKIHVWLWIKMCKNHLG